METSFYISNYVHINSKGVFANKKLLVEKVETEGLNSFLKRLYKELKVDYPKFYKMDSLSKLGIIATHLLSENQKLENNTALVFQNNAGSLQTDLQHQKTIEDKKDYFPSPAVFVYTLPNIVLGEIAIKHKLNSENAFFVAKEFTPEFIHTYTDILLKTEKANSAICGWIDLDSERYNVFLSQISKTGKTAFTAKNLNQLYHCIDE